MAGDLRHLRSSTTDKRPTASGLSDGRIAINTASGSTGVFFKDNNDNIVKVGPVFVGSGAPNASPASGGSSGNSVGEQWLDTSDGNYILKVWDGSAWRDDLVNLASSTNDGLMSSSDFVRLSGVTAGAEPNVDTNLSYDSSTRVLSSSTGSGITLPEVVAGGDSGLLTGADKTKLNGVASGAEVNVDTNLSYTASTRLLASSTGSGVTLPVVVAAGNSGLLTGADKTKLDGVASGAEVNVDTNLSYTASTRILSSSTGSGVTLPVVTAGGNPGFLTGADKTKLDGVASGAQVNAVTSVNSATGAVVLTASGIGAATAAQGALADSAIQPSGNISTLTNDSGYITSADGGNAQTLDNLDSTAFLRSDVFDTKTNGSLRFNDSVQLQMGSDGDVSFFYNNADLYLDLNTAGDSFNLRNNADSILFRVDSSGNCIASGNVLPKTDNTGAVGNSSFTWNNGQFTNLQVNSTLSVRGAIDLADSDILRFGDGDDILMFYNGNDFYIDMQDASDNIFIRNSADSVVWRVNGNGEVRYAGDIVPDTDNTGNVGTAALTWNNGRFSNLTVDGTITVRGAIDLADNDILRFGTGDDAEFFFNGTHQLLDLNGGATSFKIRNTTTDRFTFNKNGNFTATGDVTAFSDITLKSNIELIPNALDKVCQIRGVTYERDDMDGERQSGVIAQEVEKVLPEVVRTDEEGIKSIAYGNLVGLLVEAIKELKAEVEQLKGGTN